MKKFNPEAIERTIKKALVTSGAGFIGSHLVKFLYKNTDWDVHVLDALTYAGTLDNLTDNSPLRFIHADISKTEDLEFLKEENFDIIMV